MNVRSWVSAATISIALAISAAASADPVATIKSVKGDVELGKQDSKKWTPAKAGQTLRSEHLIRSSDNNGELELRLANGEPATVKVRGLVAATEYAPDTKKAKGLIWLSKAVNRAGATLFSEEVAKAAMREERPGNKGVIWDNAPEKLRMVREHIYGGNIADAATGVELILAKYPASQEAKDVLVYRGMIHLATGELEAAARDLEAGFKATTDERVKGTALFGMAMCDSYTGHMVQARDGFQRFLKEHATKGDRGHHYTEQARFMLGAIHLSEGNRRRAKRAFAELREGGAFQGESQAMLQATRPVREKSRIKR